MAASGQFLVAAVTVRLDPEQVGLLIRGLALVEKELRFTLRVQPYNSHDAIAAGDAIVVLEGLRTELQKL